MKYKTFPILLAFFVMGVADAMGPMSKGVKASYDLSETMSTLLTFFVFIAFAVFSVPGGLLAARIGKKKLLLLGLGINSLAVLVPCLCLPPYWVLLACIFALGIGTTFLQVSGNPIMRDVSDEGAYSRNLSFAQGFKGIGSTASSFLVNFIPTVAFFAALQWRGVFTIFFALMALAFVWVWTLKIEETKASVPPSIFSSLGLLGKPIFFFAVLGIFLYVGAEASMGRFLTPMLENFGFSAEKANAFGATAFFLLLTIGRLVGGGVLTVISARKFFILSALLGLLGSVCLMTGMSWLAIPAVVIAGFGFANIWPLLFSITVEEKPESANELSGLMCMAISGGAIVPLIMGQLVDLKFGSYAFVVPAACFAYLLILSLKGGRKPATV
jgi:fucose permease